MSTPFQRLRMVIDKVAIETYHNTEQIPHSQIIQPEQTDTYECFRYTVSSNRQKPRQKSKEYKLTQKSIQYYTKQDIDKIKHLYQQQKYKSNQLEIEIQRLNSLLVLKQDNISELNKTHTKKNEQFEQLRLINSQTSNQNHLKILSQKQKMYKGQIDKLNQLIDHLNKQLNNLRQKYKQLEGHSSQSSIALNGQVKSLKQSLKTQSDQISLLQQNIQQRKKLIQFNIICHQQNIKKKQKQHQIKVQQLNTTISNLNNKIQQLKQSISSHNNQNYQLQTKLSSHLESITKLKQNNDQQSLKHEHVIEQYKSKIQTMVRSLEQYQNVQKINQELERLIQEEKAKQKYHIVEVKDQTLELEVEMLKRQVKQLLKSKAIAQERLKKSCNCVRTTLVMKNQESGFGQTIKYMQGHEIKIIKQQ